jgi:hypothetical protein
MFTSNLGLIDEYTDGGFGGFSTYNPIKYWGITSQKSRSLSSNPLQSIYGL